MIKDTLISTLIGAFVIGGFFGGIAFYPQQFMMVMLSVCALFASFLIGSLIRLGFKDYE